MQKLDTDNTGYIEREEVVDSLLLSAASTTRTTTSPSLPTPPRPPSSTRYVREKVNAARELQEMLPQEALLVEQGGRSLLALRLFVVGG